MSDERADESRLARAYESCDKAVANMEPKVQRVRKPNRRRVSRETPDWEFIVGCFMWVVVAIVGGLCVVGGIAHWQRGDALTAGVFAIGAIAFYALLGLLRPRRRE